MSVTTHIAEVMRQGIWASLTGGWYYEPAYSIFCNTIHVYIWLFLMMIPLVLGLFVSGSVSIPLGAIYTGFIVFLFTFIKLIVSYCHMIFDTTDPIVITRTINDSIDEFRDSEQQPLDIEMVELSQVGLHMRGSERALDNERREVAGRSDDRDSTGGVSTRRNQGSLSGSRSVGISATSSRRVRIDDEVVAASVAVNDDTDKRGQVKTEKVQRETRRDVRVYRAIREDETKSFGMKRKSSESQLYPSRRRDRIGRRRSDPSVRTLGNWGETTQCYDDEAVAGNPKKKELSDNEERGGSTSSANPWNADGASQSVARRRPSRRRSSTGTTVSSGRRRNNRRAGSPAVFAGSLVKRESQESSRSMPSSVGWTPVVISLGDSDHPIASRYSADDAEHRPNIKMELTKFLEDLLEQHPETMDAIENVRNNFMGRRPQITEIVQPNLSAELRARNPQDTANHGIPNGSLRHATRRSSSFIDWHANPQVPSTSKHHVAQGHEDTTQGAIHSFQDEDGNWWTYTFDESGVGTAQPLGSGRAIMDILQREREKSNGETSSSRKTFPAELEVLPESMYDSTDEEKEEKDSDEEKRDIPCSSTAPREPIPLTRRERALSSSSNDSCTYLPTLPSSVFHAPSGTGATRTTNFTSSYARGFQPSNRSSRGNPIVCFSGPSRLRSIVRNTLNDSSDSMWQMEQIMELIENSHNGRNRDRATTSTMPTVLSSAQDRLFLSHLDSASSSTGPSRFRFLPFTDGPLPPPTNVTPDFGCTRRSSNVRKSYYYQMKMFPKMQKSFNIKLDRPSVDRLFDRNRCVWSLMFDIILAAIVSILAALVINADIYFDISLLLFAFLVASAHFSLLKSVQPDASSPIHGFNWVVAYSRPIYFCIGAILLLYVHYLSGGAETDRSTIPWNWNPFRLSMMSSSAIHLAFRDILSLMLLCLPLAFTFGWLPQINTLIHHIFEQIEMHIFGGTASFGVFSAFIQLVKSISVYLGLCILCHVAYTFSPNTTQSPLFSTFIAITVAFTYVLSRISSNQQLTVVLFEILVSPFWKRSAADRGVEQDDMNSNNTPGPHRDDDLPSCTRRIVFQRARYDLLFSIFLVLFFFALHSTSLFSATQPYFTQIIATVCVFLGFLNHYLYPQLRSHTPWQAISQPILRSAEYSQFESPDAAKLMTFEVIHMWMVAVERNLVYPLMVVSIITENGWKLPYPWIVLPLISIRLIRGGFANPQLMYTPVAFAVLSASFDFKNFLTIPNPHNSNKPFTSWNLLPIIMFICVAIYPKLVELYLKINFIMTYVAPWQISWGSAFHAFAQPFSIPHSAFIAIQTVISSIISAPLNPFLGSSFFTSSYVRPVKFWERDYNTKRSDASTMRLASQIDRGPMMDDSNLNAIFYEHLTRSLQKSLAGDLAMGRWSTSVEPGDCFILASFYLNCLVHIVEVGNGFVTFQLRGLEFRGTYCHQREVEAISEDIRDGPGCCCCSPGALPGFLSLNTAWGLRWLAWEVVTGKYIIDGYSISDNSAVNLLQVHELRRLLVTLYVKCIIHYSLRSGKCTQWLEDQTVLGAINPVIENPKYTDVDPMFCSTNDEDYDSAEGGISRASFTRMYEEWIDHCILKSAEVNPDQNIDREKAVIFCYLLSLVARRSLGTAAFNRHSNAAESFLYGLHALFKGDFRITCQRDEWVFTDMDMLRCVVAPAVKMALKLHQDHFAHFEEFEDHASLYDGIRDHETSIFISHEQDPGWRNAILTNVPSLLALRHVYDDGQDDYKIIMLNKMHLNMRVIKLNRECVRAFWAGQQQELIFLRNRNPERGSIQNARQVLRNMINSSADQPVGYPIYVSPLTTSHVESHAQIERIFGPTFTFERLCEFGRNVWNGLRNHFGPSGSTSIHQQQQGGMSQPTTSASSAQVPRVLFRIGTPSPIPDAARDETSDEEEEREVVTITTHGGNKENSMVELTKDGARVSIVQRSDEQSSSCSPSALAVCEAPNKPNPEKAASENIRDLMAIGAWVQIVDTEQIFKYLNEPLKSTGECLVVWPHEMVQSMSGKNSWVFQPVKGMCGKIVYTWYPNHACRAKRSHVGDYIHLIAIPLLTNGLVPIAERGCKWVSAADSGFHGLSSKNSQDRTEFLSRFNDVLALSKQDPQSVVRLKALICPPIAESVESQQEETSTTLAENSPTSESKCD